MDVMLEDKGIKEWMHSRTYSFMKLIDQEDKGIKEPETRNSCMYIQI